MEAQQLAQLGSWSWDLTSRGGDLVAELYRISVCRRGAKRSLEMFQRLLHPDDRQRVLELSSGREPPAGFGANTR